MRYLLWILLLVSQSLSAQDYGCDKCDMLREECDIASPDKKESACSFFRQECLQTDTSFVTAEGKTASASKAAVVKVTARGKCIDYSEVSEFEKSSAREIRSYLVSKTDTFYTVASSPPAFPGGDVALVKFLSSSIQYPEKARAEGVSGTAYVKLAIHKSGMVMRVKPIRGPSKELLDEAMRVVRKMPNWIPGKYKDQAVSMYYTLPVKFVLK